MRGEELNTAEWEKEPLQAQKQQRSDATDSQNYKQPSSSRISHFLNSGIASNDLIGPKPTIVVGTVDGEREGRIPIPRLLCVSETRRDANTQYASLDHWDSICSWRATLSLPDPLSMNWLLIFMPPIGASRRQKKKKTPKIGAGMTDSWRP